MQNMIPASAIVSVNPGVLSAGGSALDLQGLMLTQNTRVPTGGILSFPSALAVSDYFGSSSAEYANALVYFAGFENSHAKPGSVLFSQYNTVAVAAYLRGGDISALTLAQLQALSGTVIVAVDGTTRTGSAINFSGATSFSNAAALVQAALNASPTVLATSSSSSISGTTLTVAGTITGTFGAGQTITGAGVTAGSVITSQLSGTAGGAGTYRLAVSSTVSNQAITASTTNVVVAYDSVSGAFVITSGATGAVSTIAAATGTLAASLLLTVATGAVLSQGADAIATPAAGMGAIIALTTNFASFMTLFDPDVSGNTQKLAFATWNGQQNDKFTYVCVDTDITPTQSPAASSSLGALLGAAQVSGTVLIYEPVGTDLHLDSIVCGAIASLDFTQTNGRATLAFKSQSGLSASVNDHTDSENLIANGYNFYGAYATANDEFVFFYPGSVSGEFLWADSYVDQIWLNNQFQLALMVLLTQVPSIPYNAAGYALIRAACMDVIQQGLTFGAFRSGVTLSNAQKAEVNNAAGLVIDQVLSSQGWYLQISDASPQVRAARGSPPMTFFYMDGGSVQSITLASIAVQ